MNKDNFSLKESAEKFSPTKDFFDVSTIWSKEPTAIIIKWIYHAPVTPHQVTILAFLFGLGAALCLARQEYLFLFLGALFVQIKNILDTVDGHLARVRNTPSRIGRFLDSITDFLTNLALFAAIAFHLGSPYPSFGIWVLAFVAFLSSSLQCSYFVFYTMSYTHSISRETMSRVDESIQEEDHAAYSDPFKQNFSMFLQKLFQLFYGWQDRIMIKIDQWCIKKFVKKPLGWYHNKKFLTMTSWLALGMQLFFISFFALINQLHIYLWFVILAGNFYWLFLIFYRMKGTSWKT